METLVRKIYELYDPDQEGELIKESLQNRVIIVYYYSYLVKVVQSCAIIREEFQKNCIFLSLNGVPL